MNDAQPPPHAEWLTPTDAVSFLRLPSIRALYMACDRGTIPVHRLGRRLRFSRAELEAVLRGER